MHCTSLLGAPGGVKESVGIPPFLFLAYGKLRQELRHQFATPNDHLLDLQGNCEVFRGLYERCLDALTLLSKATLL